MFPQKFSRILSTDSRCETPLSVTSQKIDDHLQWTDYGSPLNVDFVSEVVDPFDFEDYLDRYREQIERDPLYHLLDFPEDDIEISVSPRKYRTLQHVVPENDIIDLNQHVKDCLRCYTSDWIVINRRYQQFSSACSLNNWVFDAHSLSNLDVKQEFEVDVAYSNDPAKDSSCQKNLDKPTGNIQPVAVPDENTVSSESSPHHQALQVGGPPRGSWDSSVFDLRNSEADALIPYLLDHVPSEETDVLNSSKRQEMRQDVIFSLYPLQMEDDMVEQRSLPIMPHEQLAHRIIVKCLALKLELEVEPIFGSMALYDAKERKKVSENFYFDMNAEPLKRMLSTHLCYQDVTTLSRSCIFNVTYPTSDLFLVIKLEKVLQGDINECVEPYMKEDKNKEKVKSNAVLNCERLGKYRMPFAWTAIYLMNIVNGMTNTDKDSGSDREAAGSGSLDRKFSAYSLDSFRRKQCETGTLKRQGSLERKLSCDKRGSIAQDDICSSLDSFRPVTLTVNSFFKQESDRLRDEDLYKFLTDLKRPSSLLKRLKCIPGILKLDIAPCPEEPKYCLTPELARLYPYPDEKGRPTKEILEFPIREVFMPYYSYRNLLYVYPRDVNFTNRPGSARNIACRIQFMANEEELSALPVIFGKSSCPEFTTEAFTAVTYHNRSPDFHDEVKIKLPAAYTEQYHLLFTFYHIGCQKKLEQSPTETPVGYTWFPLFKEGKLQTGDFSLPVMMDPPPPSYSFLTPFIQIPNTKWIDNHKGIFNVTINAASSIFPKDIALDRFLNLCKSIDEGSLPSRVGENNLEQELKKSMLEITKTDDSSLEPVVNFLPLVLDKLIFLLVHPPLVAGQAINIGQSAFESIAMLVHRVTTGLEEENDRHNRNKLLVTYLSYQCKPPQYNTMHHGPDARGLPPPPVNFATIGRPMSMPIQKSCFGRSNSNPDMMSYVDTDTEVSNILNKGLDRTASMRTAGGIQENILFTLTTSHSRKILHEELVLQWVVSSGVARELALQNAWFFFELIIRSMILHLASTNRMNVPRKLRFCAQFFDDITTLVTIVTSEIISRYNKEAEFKFTQNLNSSLAFFLSDLLSVVDRGYVFRLIKAYCKQMSAKISSLPDGALLISLKLEFLRIVSSHEHFVILNFPFRTSISSPSPAISPSPSVTSSSSQCSLLSGGPVADRGTFTELSADFKQQHFLVGLVLSDVAAVLKLNNTTLHMKAVKMIQNLLASHDWDGRFSEPEHKSRVACLYLPLIGIVLDALPLLNVRCSDGSRSSINGDGENCVAKGQAFSLAARSCAARRNESQVQTYGFTNQNVKVQLKEETTRDLLICFLWILKHVEKKILHHWWCGCQPQQLQQLLEVLSLCVSCFKYKGRKSVAKYSQPNSVRTTDIKSKLEDAILGHSGARSEMIKRKVSDRYPPSPSPGVEKLRWRKNQMQWKSQSESFERPKYEIEAEARVKGNLSAEVNMIVLDSLELVVQVSSQADSLQGLLSTVLRVLLQALGSNQCTLVLHNMFATQRSLVYKFPELLFEEETEQCADLCMRLLRHCSSAIGSIRSQASASLYLLMRQNFEIGNNFARVKMQVTMSLSSLVGTNQNFHEEYLRRSLKTILVYAEEDRELQETTFPEQVRDMVFNLHMILSDTVKMKEFQEDPEMLMDLMYRIAKGYQTSPDLRLTWLANMSQKHTERGNHAEAAFCLTHSAALVAEYLYLLEDKPYLPIGCVAFEKISPNILEESAVSDDVVSPDEEGICTGKYFTENGLIGLLEQAANSFAQGTMYESVNEVYKILIPIAEAHGDYKKLAAIHGKLQDIFTRIDQQAGKKVYGTFFRVGFYGKKFGDLNKEEFIYKEPYLTKLPEISDRLEAFYFEKFGCDFVEVIKDSNTVDVNKLNPEKAYIQITYVEPYFEPLGLRDRFIYLQKTHCIKRFVYATPFTPDGRAHGELHEQYKRKTVLTTSHTFPYVKTRIQVVDRAQVVLTPIEVAIEDIMKKTQELAAATSQEPSDPKILQMVLQGCIGTTVNQGPMEVAIVFLSDLVDGKKTPTSLQNKLRLSFKDFSRKCNDALRRNRTLIGPEQRDYQRELERNYHRFMERLTPMIKLNGATYSRAFREQMPRGECISKKCGHALHGQ